MAAPDRPATVVIADDDDLVRAVLRMALASELISVREAADSSSLTTVLDDEADLVILDICIPGPGLAANIALVRERAPGARILILSGDAAVPPNEVPLIDDFARKPIDLSDLRSRVDHLLAPPTVSAP